MHRDFFAVDALESAKELEELLRTRVGSRDEENRRAIFVVNKLKELTHALARKFPDMPEAADGERMALALSQSVRARIE